MSLYVSPHPMSGCHGWMDGWIKVEELDVVTVTVRARPASLGELVTYSCLVFRATATASVIRPLIINDQHNRVCSATVI